MKSKQKNELSAIIRNSHGKDLDTYRAGCEQLSKTAYLGFAVIKPLGGSPLGRTVLKCYPETPDDPEKRTRYKRLFRPCTRNYKAHFCGVELSVRGLAFQQQDVGVSACATTAIWSALQKIADHEPISPATPVQITTLATKFSLTGGRPMPSEGLNLDQMCQAVQAVGVSPSLFRVDNSAVAKAQLYSAIKSGFTPVLVLDSPSIGRHAVAVVGMKLKPTHETGTLDAKSDDVASDLLGLYIHDDRLGPYLRASFVEPRAQNGGTAKLGILLPTADEATESFWELTHILIPLHSKIRLSFACLQSVSLAIVKTALKFKSTFDIPDDEIPNGPVTHSTWITRAHKYVETLFLGINTNSPDRIEKLSTQISLARYVGVVQISSSYFDPIDILVDTTSTKRNIHCLAVIAPEIKLDYTPFVGRWLSEELRCPYIE